MAQYIEAHNHQLACLVTAGYPQLLMLQQFATNPHHFPALITCEFPLDVIMSLPQSRILSDAEKCWKVMANHLLGQQTNTNFQLSNTEMKFNLDSWLSATQSKSKYVQSMTKQILRGYIYGSDPEYQVSTDLPDLPVFLVSVEWLRYLEDDTNVVKPIDNRDLVSPSKYIDSHPTCLHYNYEIKQISGECYKVVSYQTWRNLTSVFPGFEVRRYTSRKRDSLEIELRLRKVHMVVVRERAVLEQSLELLASKEDSLSQIVVRVRRICLAYQIASQKALRNPIFMFKCVGVSKEELLNAIYNYKDEEHFYNSALSKQIIPLAPEMSLSEANITEDTIIIVNVIGPLPFLASSRSPKHAFELIDSTQSCANCQGTPALLRCNCKKLLFCPKTCFQEKKDHHQTCDALAKETQKKSALLKSYRTLTDFKTVTPSNIGRSVCGMDNLGNTCYLNAALQCFLGINEISEYFLNNRHVAELNVTNRLGSEGRLACAYGELVKRYFSGSHKRLQPRDVLEIIKQNRQFHGRNHQDSQQFLSYFIDKLHEDLKRKPGEAQDNAQGTPTIRQQNSSFIAEKLTGEYRSQVQCETCSKVSVTFDPFMSVTLSMVQQPRVIQKHVMGYFTSRDGQIQRFEADVRGDLTVKEFYEQYFHEQVVGLYQRAFKVYEVWLPHKTIRASLIEESKFTLFFFAKPTNPLMDITVEIETASKGYSNFSRKVYCDSIQSEADIYKSVSLALKRPICKSLNRKDLSDQEYLEFARENQIIRINKYSHPIFYPVTQKGEVKISLFLKLKISKVELKREGLQFQNQIGINKHLSQEYIPKMKAPKKQEEKKDSSLTLKRLLEEFSLPEMLSSENTWSCPSCKNSKRSMKTMRLEKLPQHLIIHLKRFLQRGITTEKIQAPISLLQTEIINGMKYELMGVVNHTGTLQFGHYTAYGKRDSMWFKFNDESVYKETVTGADAYLLFYRRS